MAIRIGHKVYVDTIVEFSDEGEVVFGIQGLKCVFYRKKYKLRVL